MDDSYGLTVSVSVHGQDAIVEASGELDLATAPKLEAALDEPSPEGGRVILDLRHLRFSDAQGLHSIERASRRLGPRLIVVGPTPPVRRIFKLVELERLVQLESDEAQSSDDVPASNVAYVRRLWEAFRRGGIAQLADIVPPETEWEPSDEGGRVPHGPAGLEPFWGSVADPAGFAAVGEDVLVGSAAEGHVGKEVWSLYRFEGRRLIGAATFDRQEDALAAHRLAHP